MRNDQLRDGRGSGFPPRSWIELESRTWYLRPRHRLSAGKYQVSLATSILDRGGNALPKSARKWSFRVAR